MTARIFAPFVVVAVVTLTALNPVERSVSAQAPGAGATVAIRNDRPRAGTEVLVLRHQQLQKGAHEEYYRSSRSGVWPWYEKIGTRVVGQWLVVNPGGTTNVKADDAYRLARYASFEHWQATRDGQNAALGGNGPDRQASVQSGRDRAGVQTGSRGAYFLQGEYADTRPLYMPGLAERYERIDGAAVATDALIAVRNDVAQPGRELVELRYTRIAKGGFDRFVALTRESIWPYEEKIGARPIGQWKVIYPNAPSRTQESPDFDEVITMTRFASHAHSQAMRPDRAVLMGGNGPDFQAWRAALDAQGAVTRETSVELLEGEMYHSPPVFMPGLGERYRLTP